MTHVGLQHIPLAGAYLCQDCDSIGNSAMACPACASRVLLGLACVLNREQPAVVAPVAEWPQIETVAA